jgi:formamidopyrimidine-DNA glycosylase
MPELPEVETLRRDLERSVRGATIVATTLGRLRSVRRYDDPERFVEQTEGVSFLAFGRLGKYLYARLSSGETLVIHLRMSGQMRLVDSADDSADAPLAAHTHVRFSLGDGRELRFIDPRTFGEMWVTSDDLPELGHLGPDALVALEDARGFYELLRHRRSAVKGVLLDQATLAGIGSIYADEACFLAGVRPTRPSATLTRPAVERLRIALLTVLREGIEARGSTLGDGQYVDLWGMPGAYGAGHRVHARAGEGCPACGSILRRVIVAGRSAVFCPKCQR